MTTDPPPLGTVIVPEIGVVCAEELFTDVATAPPDGATPFDPKIL
jgi:hypothetical protein